MKDIKCSMDLKWTIIASKVFDKYRCSMFLLSKILIRYFNRKAISTKISLWAIIADSIFVLGNRTLAILVLIQAQFDA